MVRFKCSQLLKPTWRRVAAFAILAALWIGWQFFSPEAQAVRRHLGEADVKSKAALSERLGAIDKLFSKGRSGSKAFSEEALSWGGKFALVKGCFGGSDCHATFLKEAFARHIFSEDELKQALAASVKGYLFDLEGVENEMLVKLRADLADLDQADESTATHLRSDEEFRKEYQRLSVEIASTMKLDTGVMIGREVGILVASEIATQVAMRAARTAAAEMGVEGGILATGAASTVATLGVGMVICVILDYVVDAVFKAAGYDPAAKIAAQVDASLCTMQRALVGDISLAGGGKKGSLREQLERLHQVRSKLRQETVARLVNGGQSE
jgi:hypothetical protein